MMKNHLGTACCTAAGAEFNADETTFLDTKRAVYVNKQCAFVDRDHAIARGEKASFRRDKRIFQLSIYISKNECGFQGSRTLR